MTSLADRLRRRPPIRVRLALSSTAGLLLVVVIGGLAMTIGLRNGLRERAHESLAPPLRVIEHALAGQPDLQLHDLLGVASTGTEQRDQVIGQILDADGRVVDSTGEPATLQPMVGRAELAAAARDGAWHEPRALPARETDDIVVVEPIRSGTRAGGFVVVAQSLAFADAEVARLVRLFLVLAPAVLATSFLGGWWIARSSLQPVDALTRRAAQIDPEVSDGGLPLPPGDDEIARLAHALNDMLSRLHQEIERQRRFSADASHELRTPLALMTTTLDVSLRSPTTPEEARPILESLREDAARLRRIVEDLLVLSRAEANGRVDLALTDVDLLDLAVGVVANLRPKAYARSVAVTVTGTPAVAAVDPHLLSQAISNLVDNALKFSPAGQHVEVEVTRDPEPCISVTDHGEGIPPDHLTRVFERFYQVDEARSTGGSGLGLAIVSSIVRAHGGTVEVESTAGKGSTFTIRLPAAVLTET